MILTELKFQRLRQNTVAIHLNESTKSKNKADKHNKGFRSDQRDPSWGKNANVDDVIVDKINLTFIIHENASSFKIIKFNDMLLKRIL